MIRRTFALAVVAATLTVPANSHQGCHSDKCRERVARKQCSQTNVRACILRASYRYEQSYPELVRVAWCESRLNPNARSAGGHLGLFQFAPGTWATTPYGRYSAYSAKWASLAAAWMWRQGRKGEWSCA